MKAVSLKNNAPQVVRRVAIFSATLVLALSTSAVTPATAHAHEQFVDVSRGDCWYRGYSDHGYAETQKLRGNCSGHAWLQINWNGNLSAWTHDPTHARVTVPNRDGIRASYHKSCADCPVEIIEH